MRRFIIGLLLLSSSTVALAQEKIPTLVNIRTKADKKHVGEVLQQTDQATVLYDIVLRDTVRIESDQIKSMVEGISEASASSHVPFASYGAWKLTKLLKVGKIQGRIALVSDQGIFINLGTNAGIASGQEVKLLGKAETITDPETDEVLAVVRPTVAMLKVTQVVNEKLSKVTLTPPETKVSIERGMLVECDRTSRTVVVIPPKWKSEDPNLKTGDEALYLTEHMLSELVGYGIPVISRDQVERIREQLAATKGQAKEDVAAIAIAEEAKAGVMLTGELLAKGNFGNVFFHATDVKSVGYLGVISGKIRRDRIRVTAEKAKATAANIRRRMDNLPPLAAEMLRRTAIAKKLVEAGVHITLKLPNGTKVSYSKLPDPDVGFPPVFAFQLVRFDDDNASLSSLLSGMTVEHVQFDLKDPKPEYFQVLNRGVIVTSILDLVGPIRDTQIGLWQPELRIIRIGYTSHLSKEWLVSQYLPKLHMLGPGGGIELKEIREISSRLPIRALRLELPHLTKGWVSFIPARITDLEIPHSGASTKEKFQRFSDALLELRDSAYFKQNLEVIRLFGHNQGTQAFYDNLLGGLFLSPEHMPTRLKAGFFDDAVKLSGEVTQRIRAAYPNVKFTTVYRKRSK